MFAVGIFGAVAIGAISLMNKGVNTSQTTLETTMARQEIDAQTEALRFIHGAFVAESNGLGTDYSDTWNTITDRTYTEASVQEEIPDFFTKENTGGQSCADLFEKRPAKAFVLNSHNLGLTDDELTGDVLVADAKLQLASTYPRMLYGRDSTSTEDLSDVDIDEGTGTQQTIAREYLYAAEGIWVTGVKSDAGANDEDGVFQSDFYDFYIQTCWDQAGSGESSTISSIIRLYNPKRIVHDDQADAYSFQLVYHANGGSGAPATQKDENITVSSHDFTISSQEPTRANYIFKGWSTSATATTAQYHGGDNIHVDKRVTTLYAVWQRQYTYKLYYNANGGSSAPSGATYGPTTDTSHTFTISTAEPQRSGYRFMGWSTSSSASHASYNSGDNITVTSESTTLYAVWSRLYFFILSYDANGGSSAPVAQSSGGVLTSSYTFTITNASATRTNYRFLGWATTSSASSAEYSAGDRITISTNTTLYAVWKRQYIVTLRYNANGGTGAPGADTYGPSDSSSHRFTIATSTPSRTNYRFLGWSTSASARTASYAPGDTITILTDTTLYAVWQRYYVYTLNYDANGGSGAPGAQSSGETDTTSYKFTVSSTQPTRSGYTFLGWSTRNTATYAEFQGGNKLTVTTETPVTLYAVWQAMYRFSLSYDANGGSGAPSDQDSGYVTTSSHTFTISSTEPTRDGYTFLGWATTKTSTSASYSAGGTITVSSNTTLYAVWRAKNRFSITYDANGGTGAPSVQYSSYTTSSSATLAISTAKPSLNTFTFLGWSTSSSALTASYQPGSPITISSNTTLYAVYDRYMQNWTGCSYLPTHDTISLIDSRDSESYNVIKLYDGRCWMQDDLAFTGSSLTIADSNVTSNRTLSYISVSACANTNTDYNNPCQYNNSGQILYNFAAATAGQVVGMYSSYRYTDATESICPQTWALPTHTEASLFTIKESSTGAWAYFKPQVKGQYYFYTAQLLTPTGTGYWLASNHGYYSHDSRDIIYFYSGSGVAVSGSTVLIGHPIRCIKKS